jgi:hypothetical protein
VPFRADCTPRVTHSLDAMPIVLTSLFRRMVLGRSLFLSGHIRRFDIDKKCDVVVFDFNDAMLNGEIEHLIAGIDGDVAGSEEREEVSVIGQDVEGADFIGGGNREGRAVVEGLRG